MNCSKDESGRKSPHERKHYGKGYRREVTGKQLIKKDLCSSKAYEGDISIRTHDLVQGAERCRERSDGINAVDVRDASHHGYRDSILCLLGTKARHT